MESNNIRCALLADQETAAGDGTAALGTQQGSDLRKPVIPGKAAGDGIAAHGTQQGSELGMSVIPGDAARPQTCYRVAPKDIQSVCPHSKRSCKHVYVVWVATSFLEVS